jgi:hypothetical protein
MPENETPEPVAAVNTITATFTASMVIDQGTAPDPEEEEDQP